MPLLIPPPLLKGNAGGSSHWVANPMTSSSSSSLSSASAVKALAITVTGYCAAWGLYYLVQDTIRNLAIAKRKRRYDEITKATSQHSGDEVSKRLQRGAVQERFAPLSILGRYVNPFAEWREQGAWEYVVWKVWGFVAHGRLWHDGGIEKFKKTPEGKAKIEEVLPRRKPSWDKYPQAVECKTPEEDWQSMSKSELTGEGTSSSSPSSQRTSITYTWIGQSTFLIHCAGLTILTDPVFQVQPVPTVWSPNRITSIPCSIQDVVSKVRLDVVLVSHNHFDHFDPQCVPFIPQHTKWIVPLGMRKLLKKSGVRRDEQIVELTWWEMRDLELSGAKLSIQSIPAIHWSGRGPFDVNQSLWTSFSMLISQANSSLKSAHIYFSGDTGYSPTYYPTLSTVLPCPPDIAFLPIGSYAPRWHMRPQHVSPADSVKIAEDIDAKKVVAMHWGTWLMSDEEWDEPPRMLQRALEEHTASTSSKAKKEAEWFTVVELGATNDVTVE